MPQRKRDSKKGKDREKPVSQDFTLSRPGRTEEDEKGQTGMGSEAAEGVNAARGKSEDARSALEDVDTGRSRPDEETVDRSGSEPLEHREKEHKSGYGGEGGRPKTSSDQREPRDTPRPGRGVE